MEINRKLKGRKRKMTALSAAACLLAASLGGCGEAAVNEAAGNSAQEQTPAKLEETAAKTVTEAAMRGQSLKDEEQPVNEEQGTSEEQYVSEEQPADSIQPAGGELLIAEYKEEDLEDSWEQDEAVMIQCSGAEVSIDGKGAKEKDGIITISSAGTYVLSGELEQGQVQIDAGKEDEVHLVLNGFTAASGNGAVINGIQSKKIILTLADGTENTISDSQEYGFENGEDEPDAAIFSKDDITINGGGSLTVNGNYQDGIRSKDDLKIISGVITVTAAADGLKGKDSVVIRDGDITVNAALDGIKSNNDTETDKGYVVIEGGSIKITSGDDGIQAETILQITDATVEIEAGGGSALAADRTGAQSGRMGGMPDGNMDGNMRGMPPGQFNQENGIENGGPLEMPDNGEMPWGTDSMPEMPDGDPTDFGGEQFPEGGAEWGSGQPTEAGTEAAAGQTAETETEMETASTLPAETETEMETASTLPADSETAADSKKGLKGGASLVITGGSVIVDAADDALHSNGNVDIYGGTFALTAGDDGIHADEGLKIENGAIEIIQSYEGLEGFTVEISGGTVQLKASDDGINSAGGSDSGEGEDFKSGGFKGGMGGFQAIEGCEIRVSGGYVYVNAAGDGLDSNGDLFIEGGTVLVSGPTSGGDGAFDYNGDAVITGGTVVAAGSAGMAQGLSKNSSQCSMLVYYDEVQTAGTPLTLVDPDGQAVVSFTPEKDYQTVVISTEKIEEGKTYTLYSGTEAENADEHGFALGGNDTGGEEQVSITQESIAVQNGSAAAGMGGIMPGKNGWGGMGPGMPKDMERQRPDGMGQLPNGNTKQGSAQQSESSPEGESELAGDPAAGSESAGDPAAKSKSAGKPAAESDPAGDPAEESETEDEPETESGPVSKQASGTKADAGDSAGDIGESV